MIPPPGISQFRVRPLYPNPTPKLDWRKKVKSDSAPSGPASGKKQIGIKERACIAAKRIGPNRDTFPEIGKELSLKPNSCARVFERTIERVPASDRENLSAVIQPSKLNPKKRPGRLKALTEAQKDNLFNLAKRDRDTRRMTVSELRNEAGLSNLSKTTISKALHERGLGSYKENMKPPINSDARKARLSFSKARFNWEPDQEWSHWKWTDEMGVTVGASWGPHHIWREKTREDKWNPDCLGRKIDQGPNIMCWGMIGWDYKGPFHVWETETEKEAQESAACISEINAVADEECKRLEAEWRGSDEWKELRKRELAETRRVRAEEKVTGIKIKVKQTYRSKKYKPKDWKIKRSEKRKGGIDAWRYVKHVARPILWPECRRLTKIDPNTVLMEDNAPAHKAGYTNREREKEGIRKANWPSRSPDFNPIEHIWNWMRREIDRRNDIGSVEGMKGALRETWAELSIDRINAEVKKLPHIMAECVLADGGNNFPD